MLEMLVAGGGKPYYPNSGPGPKSLAGGNEQAGYFGTLTQNQLFTPTELFNLLGIPTIAPTTDATLIWGKFFYKGKIVYIPTAPINSSGQLFSWQDLYQLGLVYGVDGDGAFPYPAGSPMNQRVTITKTLESKTAGFWPRLAKAGDVDPAPSTADAGSSGLGEFAELLTNILPVGIPAATNKWDNIPLASFDQVSSATMLTSLAPGTGMITGRYSSTVGRYNYGSSGKTTTTAAWRWWPVLQYINPDENLVDLTGFKADSPPPKAVDLYAVDKGDSIGGLIGVRGVRSDLIGKTIASATQILLRKPADVKVGLLSQVPRIGATTTAINPVTNPAYFTVGLLGKPPVPKVTTQPLFIAGAKVSYSPAPVTGIKLSDQ